MILNWKKLKISPAELDDVGKFNVIDNWAIALSRVLWLRQREYCPQLWLAECSILFLSLLFFFPLNLMLFRRLNLLSSSSSGLIVVLVMTLLLAELSLASLNYYLWQQAKKLKTISQLLTKVVRYNQAIENFQLLANLQRLTSERSPSDCQDTVKLDKMLQFTKNIAVLNHS